MNYLLILATALLPVILLLAYIYKSDPISEPKGLLAKAFFYGIAIIFPVIIVEGVIQQIVFAGADVSASLPVAIGQAFLVAALPEEGFKLLALWLLLRKNPYFDEHIDGIVYAVFLSLGFAAVENIFYLIDNYDNWISVGISRALLAVPGHYAFGVLMGFFYSKYYFVNRSQHNKYLIFLAPFMAHGIYDAFAMSSGVSPLFGAIGFVGLVAFCIWMHRFCSNRIGSHLHRDNKIFGNPNKYFS